MTTMSALPSDASGRLLSRSTILILAALLSTMAATLPDGRATVCLGAGGVGFGSYLALEAVARRRLHAYVAKKAADLNGGWLQPGGEAWVRQMADALELLRLGNQLGVRMHRLRRPIGWNKKRK